MPIVENLIRSNRLIYRAVDNTKDVDFLHSIQDDADALANSDTGLLRPETYKNSKEYADYVANKTLLGVIICEAPTSTSSSTVPIGSMHLTMLKPNQVHHRHAHISIKIVREYQRKGYGAEAIS